MKTRLAGLLIGLLLVGGIWWGAQPARFSGGNETPVVASGPKTATARSGLPQRDRGVSSARNGHQRGSKIDPLIADQEISRLLADDEISVMDAAKGLLAMATDSRIAAELRADALQHGLNLVTDEDYADLVLADLESNYFETSGMQRLLLDDTYNRTDSAQLPAALALLKNSQGEIRSEAKELLMFLLGPDADSYGDDYQKWHSAVIRRMAQISQQDE